MFDIGFEKIFVILVVALLVLGPKRLPELARTLGKGLGELRKAFSDVKEDFEKELRSSTPPQAGHAGPPPPGAPPPGTPPTEVKSNYPIGQFDPAQPPRDENQGELPFKQEGAGSVVEAPGGENGGSRAPGGGGPDV